MKKKLLIWVPKALIAWRSVLDFKARVGLARLFGNHEILVLHEY